MSFVTLHRAKDLVKLMMLNLRLWPQALPLFTERCSLSDADCEASLIEHENLSCCQSHTGCVFPPFLNGCSIQPFTRLPPRLLLLAGFAVGIPWLDGRFGIFFLIEACVCVQPYSVESIVSVGGGGLDERGI